MYKFSELLFRTFVVLVLGWMLFVSLMYLSDNHFFDGPFFVLLFAMGVPLLYFPLRWIAQPLREDEKKHDAHFMRTKIPAMALIVVAGSSLGLYSFGYLSAGDKKPVASAANEAFDLPGCLSAANTSDQNSQRIARDECFEKAQRAGVPVHGH